MRKGIVGAVILACVLIFGGTALAGVDLSETVTLSGGIDLNVGAPDFEVGMDMDWKLEVVSGAFEAEFKVDYDLDGDIDVVTTIEYTGSEIADFTLSTDTDVDLYDLNGDLLKDEGGLKVSSEYLTLWIGNTLVDEEVKWDIGVDLEYDLDIVTLSARVLNFGDTEIIGYAGKAVADLDSLALTGEYGIQDEASAYFVKAKYSLTDGSVTASYLMDFVEATTIKAQLAYPLTDILDLTLDWKGVTPADGDMASTIGAQIKASMTDDVTVKFDVDSVEGEDITYGLGIEVGF